MKEIEFIKEHYKPVQPTVGVDDSEILYHELRPDKKLENFIYCFWQLKAYKTLHKAFVYRVVSDGCIDIFFEHRRPGENFVMGFCRKFVQFPIGNEFNYIGIRFLPSAFPLLFGVNAKELSNQSQELKRVLPRFSEWIETEIHPKQTFEQIATLLNEKLFFLTQNHPFDFDPRFFNALNLIFKQKGVVDTETDLNTGLSPRQLRRIFNFYIGTTPKVFGNVVRFQHILNSKPSGQSLKENKFYYDVGFFDQAHFIKSFKTFYGVTPSRAFR